MEDLKEQQHKITQGQEESVYSYIYRFSNRITRFPARNRKEEVNCFISGLKMKLRIQCWHIKEFDNILEVEYYAKYLEYIQKTGKAINTISKTKPKKYVHFAESSV